MCDAEGQGTWERATDPPLSCTDSDVELVVKAKQPREATVRLCVSPLQRQGVWWSFDTRSAFMAL